MKSVCFIFLAAVAGCTTPIVPVVGERVFVVREASSVDLPDPTPPARIWYVVDDVCLKEWLGLETVIGQSGGVITSVEVKNAR